MNKIFNKDIEVSFEINPFEIKSIKKSNVEIIYQQDSNWAKSWPILFPVCGVVNGNLEHNGKELGIGRHGFFKDIKNWNVVDKTQNKIKLNYISEEGFYKIYPFRFELNITLLIENDDFTIDIEVINLENESMYFSLGHHPGFIFNEKSKITLREKQLFTDSFSAGLVESLDKNIEIESFGFDDLDFSESKSYLSDNFLGESIILNNGNIEFRVSTNNFKNLVFWRESNECSFICIENWNGIPDMLDRKSKEIKDKPEIISLNAKEKRSYKLKIEF
ncbi:hypothetical protein [Spiroplasma endosymbiont of Diplazon laetatorius]|uniref:aldose epimerase family protein n=1 Tax=Spiroplasma endosymbiont of Diplazon laetatorius TaxID=3066322 RepID=UPI0030CF6ACF